MKRVLITGAGGFVGKYLSTYLQNQGYDVVGIVRKQNEEYGFPTIVQDLSNPIKWERSFDAIIHAAGSLPRSQNDFRIFKKNNIDSMVHLIEFAQKNNIPNLIYLSTIGIYGEFHDELVNENTDIINPDYYGITKYAAELLLKAETNINHISIRMPGIIGKGSLGVWLTRTVEKFIHNEDVKIYTPDFVSKNFVHINDLANFIAILLGENTFEKDTVVLACSEGASIREIVRIITERLGSKSQIIVDNSIRKPFCIDNRVAIQMGYKSMSVLEIIEMYLKDIRKPKMK